MQRRRSGRALVCGNQYAGFEGAVLYISGFEIVHRYVYVLIPLEGEPTLVFPAKLAGSATSEALGERPGLAGHSGQVAARAQPRRSGSESASMG